MHSTPSVSPLSNRGISQQDANDETRANGVEAQEGTATVAEDDLNGMAGPDDRSSSLSDVEGSLEDQEEPLVPKHVSTMIEDDNDSEASTELLERTPQKLDRNTGLRKGLVRTSSKLNRTTSQNEDPLDDDISVQGEDSASPSTARKGTSKSRLTYEEKC